MPAEWLYERGVGEARAALVEDGAIGEARIERDDARPRVGAVVAARLGAMLPGSSRFLAQLESGATVLLPPSSAAAKARGGFSEGAPIRVRITREAMLERGNPKPPLAHLAPDMDLTDGPDLHARIAASGLAIRTVPSHGRDLLEAAGWSDQIDEAATGLIAFAGGLLRLSLTPAMSLFDVDGRLPPAELAVAGAAATAVAIRRFDIGGSIGIDLPTVASKAVRLAAADALDAALPQPFERTAVNGFGFVQIVRPRARVSLPELLQADPVKAAALALLRQAERASGAGRRTLAAVPTVVRALAARADWIAELERRIGAPVALRELPDASISAGHVESEHP